MRLVLLVLLALVAVPTFAVAAHAWIQPGEAWNGGICTLNFVYDGVGPLAGRVFVASAAHCVSGVGEAVSVDGLGQIGRVVYVGDANWGGAQSPGRVDVSLIEVNAANVANVLPDVKGHPGLPHGYSTAATASPGAPLVVSGYGLGFTTTQTTRENRTGVLLAQTTRGYEAYDATIYGDSGGPIVELLSGRAVGIVRGVGIYQTVSTSPGTLGAFDDGPSVEGILSDLAAAGWPVALRNAS